MTRLFRSFAAVATLAAAALLVACGPKTNPPEGFATCQDPNVICLPAGGGAAQCIDLATDVNNCGGCGNVCGAPALGGVPACVSGQCVPGCSNGLTVCGIGEADAGSDAGDQSALVCIDTSIDPNHCGACGTRCLDTQQCQAGACVPAGQPGQGTTACGTSADGGIVYQNLQIDPNNCGACGNKCASSEICLAGACNPCEFQACNNVCVDLNTDPNNCGACGVAVAAGGSCNNGTPWTIPVVRIVSPTSMTAVTPGLLPSNFPTITVAVDSGIRIQSVQVVATLSVVSNGVGTIYVSAPLTLSLQTDADVSPTDWSFSWDALQLATQNGTASTGEMPAIPATAQGAAPATIKLVFTAFDEQYVSTRPDAASHMSAPFTWNGVEGTVQTLPVGSIAAPSIATTGVGGGQLPAGAWIPLNAGPLTIAETLNNGLSLQASSNIVGVEFHSAPSSGSGTEVILGGANSVIPLTGGSSASITVNPGDLGVGPRTVYADLVDIFGGRNVGSATVKIVVGDLPTYTNSTLPVLARGTDGADAIWLTGPSLAVDGGTAAPFYVQAANAVASNGTHVGAAADNNAVFFATSMTETYESTGVFGVKLDGTVTRFDGISTAKDGYITPPQGVIFNSIYPQSVSGQALALTDTSGDLWFAAASLDGGDAAPSPVDGGTLFAADSSLGGGVGAIQQSSSGALYAFARIPGSGSVAFDYDLEIFHPAMNSGAASPHLKSIALDAGTTPSGLSVFPSGEFVWQEEESATGRLSLGAGRYDGSATPPADTTGAALSVAGAAAAALSGNVLPIGIQATGDSYGSASAFFVPKPGILVGLTPSKSTKASSGSISTSIQPAVSTLQPAGSEIIEIDLTSSPAKIYQPLQINLAGSTALVGDIPPGVLTRYGSLAQLTVSDDLTKVLFVTADPQTGTAQLTYTVRLLDLATGAVSSVFSSPYLDQTGAEGTPHFLHGMNSYASLPAATAPILIWGERLPVAGSSGSLAQAGSPTSTIYERLYYANYSSGATPVQISELGFAQIGNTKVVAGQQLIVESVTANALFFLGDDGDGEFSLYSRPFDGGASAQLLTRGVTNWQLREDVARQVVLRSDGTLLAGSLSGGAALNTIYKSDSGGDLNLALMPFAGLTPDGNHAWTLDHVGESYYGNSAFLIDGTLVTIDLASGARTDWGSSFNFVVEPGAPAFVTLGAGAAALYGIDRTGVDEDATRVFFAAAPNGTAHTSVNLPFQFPNNLIAGSTRVSLDYNEALFMPSPQYTADLTADKTTAAEYLSDDMVTAPYLGRPQPELTAFGPAFLPQWEIANVNGNGLFKQFGGASYSAPFTLAASGQIGTYTSKTGQLVRETPDYTQVLGQLYDSATEAYFVAALPDTGVVPPSVIAPQ